MYKIHIEKLVELITSPIITPFNLIEYLKLENYKSMNFYKKGNNIIAEVTFISYEVFENTLYYVFNHDNELLEIYQIEDENKIICFNRKTEKERIVNELNDSREITTLIKSS